jgi:hypothetical protein
MNQTNLKMKKFRPRRFKTVSTELLKVPQMRLKPQSRLRIPNGWRDFDKSSLHVGGNIHFRVSNQNALY